MVEEDEAKERTSGDKRGEGEAREGEEALAGMPGEPRDDDARTRASHALETLEVRLAILACDAMVAADLDGYIPFLSTAWGWGSALVRAPFRLPLLLRVLVPPSAAASSCAAMVARNCRMTFLDSLALARASSRSARTVS